MSRDSPCVEPPQSQGLATLRQIADQHGWYDREMDLSGMDTFNRYDSSVFSQQVRNFGYTNLASITPGECDFLFSTLLRDAKLRGALPLTWQAYADLLCEAMAQILSQQVSTPEKSSSKWDYCRGEYTRFMMEREGLRKLDTTCDKATARYNKVVINWRFD
jgi:hypothetical protein